MGYSKRILYTPTPSVIVRMVHNTDTFTSLLDDTVQYKQLMSFIDILFLTYRNYY